MSLHHSKVFSRPLALATAALIIHVGTATAADSTHDTHQQMEDLLAGVATTHSEPRGNTATNTTADAQESVKQLLLGTSRSAHSEVARDARERQSAHTDTQIAVQQVLLGQHDARSASLLTSQLTP